MFHFIFISVHNAKNTHWKLPADATYIFTGRIDNSIRFLNSVRFSYEVTKQYNVDLTSYNEIFISFQNVYKLKFQELSEEDQAPTY